MIDLSVTIQHAPWVPERRAWTDAMVAQLHAESPETPIAVIADTQREGCWPTFRRALEAASGTSHHIALQDDLELCKDFVPTVEALIRARPGHIMNLYTNSISATLARRRGEVWLEQPAAAGPAMIWPRALIDEFLAWTDRHIDADFKFDTVRVAIWQFKTGRPGFATIPSLIQHLGATSSTLGLNDTDKVASHYIGADVSGLTIDWSRGLESATRDTSLSPKWLRYYRE